MSYKIKCQFGIQMIIYRILLDYCFLHSVVSMFVDSRSWLNGYYVENEFDMVFYLLSWIIYLCSLFFARQWYESKTPSTLILMFLYCISFVPFTTMLGMSCFELSFMGFVLVYWLSMYLLHTLLCSNDKTQSAIYEVNPSKIFWGCLFVISSLVTLYQSSFMNFRINLNISNVYIFRSEARELNLPTIMSYLNGFCRVILPTSIAYFLHKRKFLIGGFFVFLALLNYSFDGGKTILLISFVAVVTGLFCDKSFKTKLPQYLNIFFITGVIEGILFQTQYLYQFVARRLFFVPNLLSRAFFDYMKKATPNLFVNLFRLIGIDVEIRDIAYLVSEKYFGVSGSANTGTIGDAFWQFSYAGAILLPFLIVALLKFYDKTTKYASDEFLIIPSLVFAYYLNNSSFSSACIGHGLLPFCLMMLLYCGRKEKSFKDLQKV